MRFSDINTKPSELEIATDQEVCEALTEGLWLLRKTVESPPQDLVSELTRIHTAITVIYYELKKRGL